MRIAVTSLVVAAGLMACSRPAPEPPTAPRVTILTPAAGDSTTTAVHVTLSAEGVVVEAATGTRADGRGHHHLFIDVDPTQTDQAIPAGVPGIVHLGTGVSEYHLEGLAPGPHRIIAVLAWGDHVPMSGVATDTVSFVVR